MLAKVHNVKTVVANKNHICSFSGSVIPKGSLYYTISFHPGNMEFEFDTELFQTYKVSFDQFGDFIKASVYFIPVEEDADELNEDVEVVENVLHAFWNKWRDKAGIADLLKSVKNRLKLPV